MNYQKVYDQIVDRAKKVNRVHGEGVYYERHHIVPKCMGGEGRVEQWKNSSKYSSTHSKRAFFMSLAIV